jgi:hypothetical protein
LEDGNGISDGNRTKRMRRRDVDRLMGGENGEGVFTWRERNRKKVLLSLINHLPFHAHWLMIISWPTLCEYSSHAHH